MPDSLRRKHLIAAVRSQALDEGALWLAARLHEARAQSLSALTTDQLAAIAGAGSVPASPVTPRWHPAAIAVGVLAVAAAADLFNVFSVQLPHLVQVAVAATL